ncbi:MAG TPA: BadF/BadG/BcrA/BcrD ATPase family protein, partial [Rectinemataceae bacterium]|nr:BadF/BadG/BcrA/BcrD ATPase family protein [Rectinemataceae bacterium]
MKGGYKLGVDVGSTTVKTMLLGGDGEPLFSRYARHRSDVSGALSSLLAEAAGHLESLAPGASTSLMVTGSAGIGAAKRLGLAFVQEVAACARAVEVLLPETDVAIELGGEDAKITYFGATIEERMNGSCAGGTGAFIDQMASLLDTDPSGLDLLAAGANIVYPIASRCGVFAKADVQPLINEGARREDVAASVFQAVVNQTISGLACGRPIRGRVALLGGPLHYLPQLRKRFADTLKLAPDALLLPKDGRLVVATGAALSVDKAAARGEASPTYTVAELRELAVRAAQAPAGEERAPRLPPLFAEDRELSEFRERHASASLPRAELASHRGPLFVGLDAGSTTSKLVAVDEEGRVLFSSYASNRGHPLDTMGAALGALYAAMPEASRVANSCATGYGEGLVRAAFGVDEGEVETVVHCLAASRLAPDVDAVLDIGGQDMKFLKIEEGVISSILLNEACSSGCGSFLETFAKSMGHGVESFAALALGAVSPVDLGSRCTVFMNSRVKQAQKEGATPADISAGLAYSVVKNALQKVIRVRDPRELGKRVVVQGGTFASEAVLRAFERIAGFEAVRPAEPGLMGAWGAALLAIQKAQRRPSGLVASSSLVGPGGLSSFSASSESLRCKGCGNACLLTVTRFDRPGAIEGGAASAAKDSFVSGNRCERGAQLALASLASSEASPGPARPRVPEVDGQVERSGEGAEGTDSPPDLYAWKYSRLFRYAPTPLAEARRGRIGMPRVLNFYENYPFWFTLFTSLGFRVELSPRSTKALFESGMESMPSESVCYPAKLVHGHAQWLLGRGLPAIFYPCIPREERFVEGTNDTYNCPIVTSYP